MPEPQLDVVYKPSDDVVAREIEGEFILVPITAGIGDLEDELYSLNDSGKAIWDKLDGKASLKQVVDELAADFDASTDELRQDVLGFVGELLSRKILVAI